MFYFCIIDEIIINNFIKLENVKYSLILKHILLKHCSFVTIENHF